MFTTKRLALSSFLISILILSTICFADAESSFAATKKIHLDKTKITLNVSGLDQWYQQQLIDKKGKTIKATKVKWKSTKASIAKINKKGKITAVKAGTVKMTAKYKGKTYKFTVKVTNYYTYNDTVIVRGSIGKAADCTDYVVDEVDGWGNDNYSSNSSYLREIRNDFSNAADYLKKAQKITKNRERRYCKINNSYSTWNDMVNSLLETCNTISTTDVSSMTEREKMSFAANILQTVISLENAYTEVDSWDPKKERY